MPWLTPTRKIKTHNQLMNLYCTCTNYNASHETLINYQFNFHFSIAEIERIATFFQQVLVKYYSLVSTFEIDTKHTLVLIYVIVLNKCKRKATHNLYTSIEQLINIINMSWGSNWFTWSNNWLFRTHTRIIRQRRNYVL